MKYPLKESFQVISGTGLKSSLFRYRRLNYHQASRENILDLNEYWESGKIGLSRKVCFLWIQSGKWVLAVMGSLGCLPAAFTLAWLLKLSFFQWNPQGCFSLRRDFSRPSLSWEPGEGLRRFRAKQTPCSRKYNKRWKLTYGATLFTLPAEKPSQMH